MAGKNDKVSGVYEIYCESTGFAYLGKSTGVGVAVRSAKSKLKNNKFHNKSLQKEYNEMGASSYVFDVHLTDDEFSLPDLLSRITDEIVEDGIILHNDIDVIEGENIFETIDRLNDNQKEAVSRLISGLAGGFSMSEVIAFLDKNKL